jgi:hypothetical protein
VGRRAECCVEEKFSSPSWKCNPELSAVRSVDRHYTGWAIPAPDIVHVELLILDLYIECSSAEVRKDSFASTPPTRLLGVILYRSEPLNVIL